MFLYCKWQGKEIDCSSVVKQRKTDAGFCCSVNTVDLAETYATDIQEDSAHPVETNNCNNQYLSDYQHESASDNQSESASNYQSESYAHNSESQEETQSTSHSKEKREVGYYHEAAR